MNVFKKAYARIYEGSFRFVLPVLPYRNPKILNSILDVYSEIESKGLSKPIIITDKVIISTGLVDKLINCLEEHNIIPTIYDKVLPNPTTDMVEEVRANYIKDSRDSIIAVGGGSVMDCAKALGARISCPKKSLQKMGGILKVRRSIPYLIAIPTTSGTGSETTLAAVIVDSKTRHKYAINDFPLIPKVAVLDPSATKTLPPHILSTTGVDALTHAVEAYIGRSTTISTRKDALHAIKLIFENLEDAYINPTEKNRMNMLMASHYAGRSFSKSYVGYVHALAHALGGAYDTPHGLANAILLPYVLESYGAHIYKKIKKIAVYIGLVDKDCNKAEAYRVFMDRLTDMLEKLNIPKKVQALKEEDIDHLVDYAYKEAYPLYPVPVLYDKKDLRKIYEKVIVR